MVTIQDIIRAVADAALSDDERLGFLDLCEARSSNELLADRDRVRSYRAMVERGIEDGRDLEGKLVAPIATVLIALLEKAHEWSYAERRVLAGAVEYFIRSDDIDADFASSHGLEDDARVVMAVADALNRSDLVAELRTLLT